MPRQSIKLHLDLSVSDNKRRLIQSIGTLTGQYEVNIEPRRLTRSNAQNAWYWACITPALAEYLAQQDYDGCDPDTAHEILKDKFLRVPMVNKASGEMLGYRTRSTTELSTVEFSDYCERCRAWMLDFFGIIVSDPGVAEIKSKAGRFAPKAEV
jgi:hypothetical protein